jgi:hypothetical protein
MGMKIVASITALNLAVAFATPIVAAEIPMTKADCEKAGMKWKEWAEKNKCRPIVRKDRRLFSDQVANVLGIIGLGSVLLGLIVLYRERLT